MLLTPTWPQLNLAIVIMKPSRSFSWMWTGSSTAETGRNNIIFADTIRTMGNRHRIVYSPTVVEKINQWSEVAEVMWLTSWGSRATDDLAPRLGLKAFPVLPFDRNRLFKNTTKAGCAEQIAKTMGPGRLLIWLDDDFKLWLPITKPSPDDWQFTEGFVHEHIKKTCLHPEDDCRLRPNSLYISPWCAITWRWSMHAWPTLH